VTTNQQEPKGWQSPGVVGLGVPVGSFFSAHPGHTLTDLVNTVAAAKGLGSAKQKFDLCTGHLVEADLLARGPRPAFDATCQEDIVKGAGNSARGKSLDPDVALLAFEVGGLELQGQDPSIVISVHGAEILLLATHCASVMMLIVTFDGPVSAARR
jgi:hypothetical protein